VRGHLRRWFEGQGAVLTSARVQALRRSAAVAPAAAADPHEEPWYEDDDDAPLLRETRL